MNDTPESFDQFIKSKLDEVEVTPSLADKYWKETKLPSGKPSGTDKFSFYYWFSATVLLATFALFTLIKKDKNTGTKNQQPDSVTQVKNISVLSNHNPLTTINSEKQPDTLPQNKPHLTDKNNSKISDANKRKDVINVQLDKSIADSNLPAKPVVDTRSLSQLINTDSIINNEHREILNIEKPPDIVLKKIDSANKKIENKKKAPYIIW